MIVGVTGFFCAGKDTAAELLATKGFAHISLSDMIRDELRRQGKTIDVPHMTELGNELRRTRGPGVLARKALARMDFSRNWVVTSIRNPVEVQALRERPDFVMLFIDAPQRVRFERSLLRARAGDPQTFEEFAAMEARQMHPVEGDPSAQQLAACRDAADATILNDADPAALRDKLTTFMQTALFQHFLPRPSWDEYFMMMAEVAATRGNCIKRRVGAVIVQEKQVVSTGYNGTPKGITNCFEGGCPRGAAVADSGAALGECLGVHAEENAIIQAAAHGVAIRGGTLYCTLCPCSYCAKSIINAGIKEVVYAAAYCMDDVTKMLFECAGVKARVLDQPRITVRPVFNDAPLPPAQ